MKLAACLLLLAVLYFTSSTATSHNSKDVCIIGAGTGGMTAAGRLHELGYSVVVFEAEADLGGCCDTVFFDPPAGGTINYIDTGVQSFLNTTKANAAGLGPWEDVVGWITKFVGAANIVPGGAVAATTPTYAADFKTGTNFGLQTATSDPAVADALTRYFGVLAQWPWIDHPDWPATIPSDLLMPFSDFIVKYNLSALATSIFESITYSGGMGYYDQLTSLYAVAGSGPTILLSITSSDGTYGIKGGCIQYYNGIADTIGWNNVVRNANIKSVVRPLFGKVQVKGEVRSGAGDRTRNKFTYYCDDVIIAFAPTLESLSFFDLDRTERNLYRNVRTRAYAASAISIDGPLDDAGSLIVLNIDPTRQYGYPELPAPTAIIRGAPYGPAQAPAVSNSPISLDAFEAAVQDSLSRLPSSMFTSINVTDFFSHAFQPHFVNSSLTNNPNPHTLLRTLEGYRNTWVVGAIDSFADSTHIIHRTLRLINTRFPSKSHHRSEE